MPSHEAAIEFELRHKGAASAPELAQRLKASQPTVSRALTRLGPQVVRIGRARKSRYALRREVAGFNSSWPMYEIDAHGRPSKIGQLSALGGRQWLFEQESPWPTMRGTDFAEGLYPDLPWFFEDLRPQGFLGRVFANQVATQLGASKDPRLWNSDEIVAALLRYGRDLPGSFVLGEEMLSEIQRRDPFDTAISPEHTSKIYPEMAESILRGTWPGSSAGGEQPKFMAKLREEDGKSRDVLVKFSARSDAPDAQRWADLLAAESVAASILRKSGIPSAVSTISEYDGRYFLESTRFDRTRSSGRIGVVSLAAIDGAYFGEVNTPWRLMAEQLHQQGWLTKEEQRRLTLIWWFGSMIANTDMHHGNMSFYLSPSPPLSLTPVYDMGPMLYRPGPQGMLPEMEFQPPPPIPEELDLYRDAAEMALQFWHECSTHFLISADFREVAAQNKVIVAKAIRRYLS